MLFMLCGGIFRRAGDPELLVASPGHRSYLRLFFDALTILALALMISAIPTRIASNSYEIRFLHLLPTPP